MNIAYKCDRCSNYVLRGYEIYIRYGDASSALCGECAEAAPYHVLTFEWFLSEAQLEYLERMRTHMADMQKASSACWKRYTLGQFSDSHRTHWVISHD